MRTKTIKIDPKNPDLALIAKAAKIIKDGGLVAFPTETVYGLGASYFDKKAVERIYKIKKRPKNKPLSLHVDDFGVLNELNCDVTPQAGQVISRFWPGPLTIILKSKDNQKGVGFRMPRNRIARFLIKRSGVPIVAPSANLSGNKPPRNAGDVKRDLDGKIDMIIDAGEVELGVESTVLDLSGAKSKILREGAIADAVRQFLK